METLAKNGNALATKSPSFFDDFFTRDLFSWPNSMSEKQGMVPAVNIKETTENFELELAVPGMKKEDFTVELNNDKLIVSASTEHKDEEKTESYTRREFGYQTFTRTFSISEQMVKSDEIAAKYTDGILFITLPKAEEAIAKAPKRIEIS